MAELEARGSRLLAIARESIVAGDGLAGMRGWEEEWLRVPGASFVTLRCDGELRGCIGSIEPRRALGDDVAYNAYAAAYRDVRFPPLTPAIRDRLEVEVSVLSSRERVHAASEAVLAAQLRPGIDGIVVEYEGHCATFLPQVWESLPDPIDFLTELRRKARLPGRFWHERLAVSRYTVEKYR